MFTGLIETTGKILRAESRGGGKALEIRPQNPFDDAAKGHSICVDGVCLTVESLNRETFSVFAVAETVERSTLKHAKTGQSVNLERALKLGDRLGGHWVAGHVDTVGKIISEHRKGDSVEKWVEVAPKIMNQVAEKGSVAVDGVSLTVSARRDNGFMVSLVPHTMKATTLTEKGKGGLVNVETDILAKYVEYLQAGQGSGLTLESIQKMGF